MSNRSVQMMRSSCPKGLRCFLGGAVPMLGLLATILPAAADICEDGHCSVLPEDAASGARGLSLMQSGRSVLPAIATNGRGSILNDGFVDEFANMEDEFDNGSAESYYASSRSQTTTPKVAIAAHAGDACLYVETLLVICVLALIHKGLNWASAAPPASPKVSPKVAEPAPAVPSVAPATRRAEDTPIVVLGGSKDFPALEQAVREGDEARCLELLKQGGRWAIRQEDPCGCTALHVAAHCGSAAMARLLLKHGAKVDACEAWQETCLHFAARSGSAEVCDVLLNHGADIDAANADDLTPLLVAGEAKHEAVCELLLSRGAGAGGIADTDLPPLINALMFRRMFEGAIPHSSTEPEVDSDASADIADLMDADIAEIMKDADE